MAMKLYSDSDIQDIADAIRSKNGSSDTYKVSQMATAISNIPSGGGGTPLDTLYENSGLVTLTHVGTADSVQMTPSTISYSTLINQVDTNNSGSSTITVKAVSNGISSSDIGSSVLDKTYSTNVPRNNWYWGGPFIKTTTRDGKTLLTDTCIYKYTSASNGTNPPGYGGKAVTTDVYGIITGVYSSFSNLLTALQNKTVDMSNGLRIYGTSCSYGSYNTGTAQGGIKFSSI